MALRIKEIAKAIGKSEQYIRTAIRQGYFTFGTAVMLKGSTKYTYYCPDRKVWEETGSFAEVIKTSFQSMLTTYEDWQGNFSAIFLASSFSVSFLNCVASF